MDNITMCVIPSDTVLQNIKNITLRKLNRTKTDIYGNKRVLLEIFLKNMTF